MVQARIGSHTVDQQGMTRTTCAQTAAVPGVQVELTPFPYRVIDLRSASDVAAQPLPAWLQRIAVSLSGARWRQLRSTALQGANRNRLQQTQRLLRSGSRMPHHLEVTV